MASHTLSRRGFLGKGLLASALASTLPFFGKSAMAENASFLEDKDPKLKLPTLLLVAGAHQTGLHTRVKELLDSKFIVVAPKEPAGNSVDMLRKMPSWLKTYNPDVIHISTGYEDMRSMYYGTYEHLIPKKLYKRNTQQIIDFIYGISEKAIPIWGTKTPVNDEWLEAHKSKVRDWTFFCRRRRAV